MSLNDLLNCRVEGCGKPATNPGRTRCEEHDICDKCKKQRYIAHNWRYRQITRKGKPHRQICPICIESVALDLIAEYEEIHPGGIVSSSNVIICPWCGEQTSIESEDEINDWVECKMCRREYTVKYEITYSVQTFQVK